MDVRCERCATVYEFDDGQVGPAGVTVKCAQCGHLFKVRRKGEDSRVVQTLVDGGGPPKPPAGPTTAPRTTAPRGAPVTPPAALATATRPSAVPPPIGLTQPPSPPVAPVPKPGAGGPPPKAPPSTPGPQASSPSALTSPSGPPPQLPPATAAGAYEFWSVKITTSGEVFRFREMTTLQQWIVERKVGREDAISRTGDVWRKLGTIPELDPFFNIVDRALQAGGMPKADPEEPTVTATHPVRRPPPMSEASMLGDMGGPTGYGAGPPSDHTDPAARAPRRLPMGIIGGGVAFVLIVGLATVLLMRSSRGAKHRELVQQSQKLYALDTDDGFRQAAAMLTHANATNDADAMVSASLAEIKATWASYLREDARVLEQTPGAATAAQSFRREAQAHLDEAKKAAGDALAQSPDGPEVNRAMALTLCVDGSPVPEVERYLKRAADKLASDPGLVWVQGTLAQREGRTDEAKQKLAQANQLALSTGKPLLRASVALAKLALATKQFDDAQRLLKSVLDANPQHDRAKALLAAAQSATPTPVAPPAPTPTPPGPTVTAMPTPTPPPTTGTTGGAAPAAGTTTGGGGTGGEAPSSIEKIIALAEKNLENGRTAEARKLYEKALQLEPRNVEALTGLGYADLDKERFMSAVDNFKKALEVVPDYGEAIIGMAESYKVRGDREKAIEYYKRYIKVLPGGGKASMAKANLRELEASAPKPEAPKPEAPKPEAPKPDEPKPEAKPEPKTE